MALSDAQLEKEYAKWLKSLPKEEREAVKAAGVDKPLASHTGGGSKHGSGGSFSTSSKSSVQEGDCAKVVFSGEDIQDIALVSGITPLDQLLSAEERELLTGQMTQQERDIRVGAISGLLSFLFKPVNGVITPWETCIRLWLLAYTIAPSLINGISLEKMGSLYFRSSKQVLSKRMLKQSSSLSVRARNSKSASAVESYRESTTEWHKARKDEERREARRLYNAAYKAANRERIASMNASYYLNNKRRILASQTKRRSITKN